MDNDQSIRRLFQYASTYKFEEFEQIFFQFESVLPFEVFWEAYLIRAQIKLHISDPTFFDDLEKTKRAGKQAQFPLLNTVWRADAPNRFIVFYKRPGVLQEFLNKLEGADSMMAEWYGDQGVNMVCQLRSEIYYFMGDAPKTLELAREQLQTHHESGTDAILAQCIGFRSYLAFGSQKEAEQCMLDMIRLSRTCPDCMAPYQALRLWANITTSWNGDSQRFYEGESGQKLPVLEDRLESIRSGAPRTTPLEKPFVEYTAAICEDTYTVRQYYVDLFHAMYWLSVGDRAQAQSYFFKLYEIAMASDVIMPFVECGEQIVPLLQYIQNSGANCSHEWLTRVIFMATQYERNLNIYRDILN